MRTFYYINIEYVNNNNIYNETSLFLNAIKNCVNLTFNSYYDHIINFNYF